MFHIRNCRVFYSTPTSKINFFIDKIKNTLQLHTVDDWNSLTQKQIRSISDGKEYLKEYTLHEIKCIGCPDGISKFNTKTKKPKGYWEIQENIQNFLEILKEKYNLNTSKDWNSLTQNQVKLNGGFGLLKKYSMYDIKCMGNPNPNKNNEFTKPIQYKSKKYWDKKENILSFLSDLKLKFNLNSPNDWNFITRKIIKENGGSFLLSKYSIYEIKSLGCPDGKILFENQKNKIKQPNYWDNKENIYSFLNDLKVYFNFNTPQDWDTLTCEKIKSLGGLRLIRKYSLYEIKSMACPEGKNFFKKPPKNKPANFWDNEDNIHEFVDHLKNEMQLKTLNDWNRLSKTQIYAFGGWSLLHDKKLMNKIPEITFDNSNALNKRSAQRWLFLQVQKLFPDEEIIEDYFHGDISRNSGFAVQFDVFIVKRKIAFEYHGPQHYEDISSGFAGLEMYKFRDSEKMKLCSQFDVKLIVIPFWWDNTSDSLRAELKKIIGINQ